jgi:hypothetical protein
MYTDVMEDILYFTCDIMPHLNDIRSNIVAYIIAYSPVRAEPLSVLPAVSIAKMVWETFINPFQAGQ